MKRISLFLSILLCFAIVARAKAQEQESQLDPLKKLLIEETENRKHAQVEEMARRLHHRPERIWREFLGEKPTLEEVDRACWSTDEPYKTWCWQEIFSRRQSATPGEYIYVGTAAQMIVIKGIEPQAKDAWQWLKNNGNLLNFMQVLKEAKEDYQKQAIEMIEKRPDDSYISLLDHLDSIPDKYKAKIWEIFLATNPTDDDLAFVVKYKKDYRKQALDRLLILNATNDTLVGIFSYLSSSGINSENQPLKDYLANMLLDRNPNNKVLRTLAGEASSPYKEFAEEQLRLRGLEKKEILMELMLLNKTPQN